MSHNFSIKTMWRSFFCALMATVTLSIMNPFRTGKLVLFQVTYDRDWHFFEILFFVVLGIFGVRLLAMLPTSSLLINFFTGSLRCFCCQVQSTSGCFPSKIPIESRAGRSRHTSDYNGPDRIL